MADQELELTPVGVSPAIADQLAQELRRGLIAKGVPPAALRVARDPGSDAQSVGANLFVDLMNIVPAVVQQGAAIIEQGRVAVENAHPAVEGIKYGVDITAIVWGVYEVFFREKCGVRIRTKDRDVMVGPGEVDIDRLKAILKDLTDGPPPPP